jgi:hypothetical protein
MPMPVHLICLFELLNRGFAVCPTVPLKQTPARYRMDIQIKIIKFMFKVFGSFGFCQNTEQCINCHTRKSLSVNNT